jgi:hypothetical protein
MRLFSYVFSYVFSPSPRSWRGLALWSGCGGTFAHRVARYLRDICGPIAVLSSAALDLMRVIVGHGNDVILEAIDILVVGVNVCIIQVAMDTFFDVAVITRRCSHNYCALRKIVDRLDCAAHLILLGLGYWPLLRTYIIYHNRLTIARYLLSIFLPFRINELQQKLAIFLPPPDGIPRSALRVPPANNRAKRKFGVVYKYT